MKKSDLAYFCVTGLHPLLLLLTMAGCSVREERLGYLERNDRAYEYTKEEFKNELSKMLNVRLTGENYRYYKSDILLRPYGFYLKREPARTRILVYTQSDSVLDRHIVFYKGIRVRGVRTISDPKVSEGVIPSIELEIRDSESKLEEVRTKNLLIAEIYLNPESFDTWIPKFISPFELLRLAYRAASGFLSNLWTRRPPKIPSQEELSREIRITREHNFDSRERGISIMWLGHATCLVRMNGINILTDPVWCDVASFTKLAGARRHVRPPHAIEELPRIDMILISHDHYDHLDKKAVAKLGTAFPDAKWFVPLKIKAFLDYYAIKEVYEMKWGDDRTLNIDGRDVFVTSVPAQHWGFRHPGNLFGTHWCSWIVAVDGRTLYFVGDTGFCRKEFLKIGRDFDIDIAAIPIGCYEPSWFLHPQHISPTEAVALYEMVNARNALAIHWGTYNLGTSERFLQPRLDLKKACERRQVSNFRATNPGELWIIEEDGDDFHGDKQIEQWPLNAIGD
jgi:N-acyl-phosphatidylethanolamine-hydrolysing phospholipase D